MKLWNSKKYKYQDITVNTLRVLSAEMIANANSGHTGIALGAAPIMYALFHDHIIVNPKSNFFNRDRFVLSAGHGSALLYATMYVSGYSSLTMDDLKHFRQYNSKTPGHPESYITGGVDATTGPLGQGIAMGVGLAMAEAKLANKFNKYNKFIDHYTYVLFGDGCLQEGVALEAISFAGKQKLKKLIMLYDSNNIQLDGKINDTFSTNVKQLFKSNNWNYIKVRNGNDPRKISRAIKKAKLFSNKPTVIECCTTIGYGCRFQNSSSIHGIPLKEEQINELRENLNYKIAPFVIHKNVLEHMSIVGKRGSKRQKLFNQNLYKLELKNINLYNEYLNLINNKFNIKLDYFKNINFDKHIATRTLMSNMLQIICEHNSALMVGNADLAPSTLVTYKKSLSFSPANKDGQNIKYGVREFAMVSINNGILLHGGCRAIGSTFLSFSDYCKNAIRLAAISNLGNINIFSHDSIYVGEDGPTHQPVEQIWTLRLIPNHFVFRPANWVECYVALEFAIKNNTTPTTIILSRNVFENYDVECDKAKYGGYVIKDTEQHDINIIATGSELQTAFEVADLLTKNKIKSRIISFNSIELFEKQSRQYKESILDNKPTISIEFGSTAPWYKYADLCIGIDEYGKSAKPHDLVSHFNLTPDKICNTIIVWYEKYKGVK